MSTYLQKAVSSDVDTIWEILQQAIAKRKREGSTQWQDGYPNPEVIKKDVEKETGHLLIDKGNIVGYVSILINDEPAYGDIEGKWLSDSDFIVFHRVAISESYLGKGLAKKMMNLIEEFALQRQIYSIKADTNFDNYAMLSIFEKSGYSYCGEVYFRNTPRKAYEKVLK
ncbi:GNAT family N-acetyltransferase [Wenyingzhuangia sp. IMCC45574]